MTRTLTFVVGIALAVVAIAPAALGEGRLAPLYPPSQVATYRDAGERPAAQPDALDLAAAAGRLQFSVVRDALTAHRAAGPHRGAIERRVFWNPAYTTPATRQVTSGRDIEWSQLGIGLAIGMALALGLALAVHAVRARPLAH